MSCGHYVAVPGFPGLHVRVRPYVPRGRTIGLCYVGSMPELLAAGIASVEMLTTAKSGLDAAGDHYMTDARWRPRAREPEQRYRIWRRMKRARALHMPGVREALARAAADARGGAANRPKPTPDAGSSPGLTATAATG